MTITKKNLPGRHAKFTADFRAEAVRLVHNSGQPLRAIADDLGIGLSTLGKWVATHKEADLLSGPHEDTVRELARLRKENEILRQERDLLNWSRIRNRSGGSISRRNAAAFFAKETTK